MSRLNISENLFLDVNELNHLVRFIKEEGYKRLFKQIVKKYGVVRNTANNNFLVTKVDDTHVSVHSGIAFDENLNAILLNENLTIELASGIEHYICIRYAESHIEEGVVSISPNGDLVGIGTKFTDVLRGQPNFPTKVKFESGVNVYEYEVVSVLSDTNAILSGDFVSESNLKYSVVGTFTPGALISEDKVQIYSYDSCEIFIVDGDTLTVPTLDDNEYFIAKITYSGNELLVTDFRSRNIFKITGGNSSEPSLQFITTPYVNVGVVNPTSVERIYMPSGTNIVSSIEFLIEFSYFIQSFSISGNTFTINSGSSYKYETIGSVPNGTFNGSMLYNKTTGSKVLITEFNAGVCTLNSEIQVSQNDEIYIIPNANEIEIEIINLQDSFNVPTHYIKNVEDCKAFLQLNFAQYSQNQNNSQQQDERGISVINPQVIIKYRLITEDGVSLYGDIEPCIYKNMIDYSEKIYTKEGIEIEVSALKI